MKNLTFLLPVFFVGISLISCTSELQQPENSESLQKENFGQLLDLNLKQEKEEVTRHYHLQDLAFRSKITLKEYHRDLSSKYNKVVKELSEQFQFLDPGEDPDTQVYHLRDSLMDENEVPLWYRNL
ncbi:MAG: hypothetical protein WBA74_09345, partial [Cyclobacteriaceae bacterium]